MTSPTYVLVHGAFHGAWCWRAVGEELTRRELPWTALDLPSSAPGASPHTYLEDDALAVAAIANEEGPVILVGHSYGGSVISEAAALIHDLRGLVYVCAPVPNDGESSTDASRVVRVRTKLDEAIRVNGDMLSLDPALAAEALAQDLPEGEQRYLLERLSTQTLASFRSPRANPDTTAPRRYVLCEFDQSIDPATQEILAQRCDEVVSLPSGHSPYFSMPHTLTDAIVA